VSEPVDPKPAGPDPWKSFRGVMAGTLILEVIVVLLALPVVSNSHGGLTWVSGGFLLGVTGILILLAGVQGKPWALKANLGMQVVLIGGVVIHPAICFIGVVFAAVWLLIAYLRAEVKRRQDSGLLPGQQSPPTDG